MGIFNIEHAYPVDSEPSLRVPAPAVQRQLGLNRYETVWTMLHKLRRAMVAPNREPLRGIIEVDETYIGGPEHGATIWLPHHGVDPQHLQAYLGPTTYYQLYRLESTG
jgi:hypothetical protein